MSVVRVEGEGAGAAAALLPLGVHAAGAAGDGRARVEDALRRDEGHAVVREELDGEGPRDVLEPRAVLEAEGRLGVGEVGRAAVAEVGDLVLERRDAADGRVPGQEKGETFPTLEARISIVFHSIWLIFGRAIVSRDELKAWMLSSWKSLREHQR